MFAGLRNIPDDQIDREVKRLLKEVSLTEEAKTRTASFSGGMRRRLSVAIGTSLLYIYIIVLTLDSPYREP